MFLAWRFLNDARLALSAVTLTFARTFRLSTLLAEPNEPVFAFVFNDNSMRLAAR